MKIDTSSRPSSPKLRHTPASRSRMILGLTAAIAALGTTSAFAQATWTGATSQDWNTTSNWNVAPTGNLTVNTATPGVFPVLAATSAVTPVDLFIGDGTGNTGRLDQSSGTLALNNSGTNGNWMFVGVNNGTGTYNLTGDGSLAVGKLWIGGFVYGENGTGTVTVNTTGTLTANSTDDFSGWGQYQTSLNIGWGTHPVGTGNGTLNLQNGTINTPNRAIYVGSWGSTGTLNQTGGTINANGLTVGKWFSNTAAPSSVNVSAGTLNTAWISLNAAGNGGDANAGVINISGTGTVNSEGDVTITQGGSGTSTGVINVDTGGTLNVGTTAKRWLVVSAFDTSAGQLNVNGGNLNLNAGTDLRFSINGNTGASSVNLNSGAITAHSGNGTGAGSTGVLDLNMAGGAGANNTLNLNGGTLTIGQIMTTADAGTATVNFNGGTLKATIATANFVDLGGAGQTAVVKAGGAIIDSNGVNVTIPQALLDGTGGGGLTKNGSGTLTLAGANTYTGATTVNGGTLAVSSTGSLSGTTVTIGSGAGFNYNGTAAFTGTLVNNGGTISGSGALNVDLALNSLADHVAPGNSPGIQTFGADQNWSSFTYDWEVNDFTGTVAGTAFDQIAITGGLTLTLGGSYQLNVLSLDAGNASGLAQNFSEINRTWTIATTTTGIANFDAADWTIDVTGFQNVEGGTFSVSQVGNDLVLSYAAIPEPSTYAALLGAAALGFVAVRRRRSQASALTT